MRIDEPALAGAAAKGELSGVVTIQTAERRLYERHYGFAHRALGVPNTLTTRFALASGTKTFTAAAVLRLVELGKLELSDLVRPLLGADLPLVDDSVTIEQLLDHTCGIGDYLDEEAQWDAADYILDVPVHTLAETSAFLPVIDGYPQAFAPGERFSYCNGGYILLAILIERVSATGFHDFVQEQVFDRAGMRASGFLPPTSFPATRRSATCTRTVTGRTCCTCRFAATGTGGRTPPRKTCTGSGPHCRPDTSLATRCVRRCAGRAMSSLTRG